MQSTWYYLMYELEPMFRTIIILLCRTTIYHERPWQDRKSKGGISEGFVVWGPLASTVGRPSARLRYNSRTYSYELEALRNRGNLRWFHLDSGAQFNLKENENKRFDAIDKSLHFMRCF